MCLTNGNGPYFSCWNVKTYIYDTDLALGEYIIKQPNTSFFYAKADNEITDWNILV